MHCKDRKKEKPWEFFPKRSIFIYSWFRTSRQNVWAHANVEGCFSISWQSGQMREAWSWSKDCRMKLVALSESGITLLLPTTPTFSLSAFLCLLIVGTAVALLEATNAEIFVEHCQLFRIVSRCCPCRHLFDTLNKTPLNNAFRFGFEWRHSERAPQFVPMTWENFYLDIR